MPAKSPPVTETVANQAGLLGRQIRERRKLLGVSATVAAESAGVSRVTWHRMERGELSVTLGAYLAALHVLGMHLDTDISVGDKAHPLANDDDYLPLSISLADYPQLRQLAWQLQGTDTLSPREALAIYERNWRHLDVVLLEPHERKLIDKLKAVLSAGGGHV